MPTPVPVQSAPLASGDPTRRFGIEMDGTVVFPGLTRPEAESVAGWLGDVEHPHRMLIPVEIGVVLSDGAGPHLLDATGVLVLVLGAQSHIDGAMVAMGAPNPHQAIGGVTLRGAHWMWLARRDVPEASRVMALDELDACSDVAGLAAWEAAGNVLPRTLGP